MREQRDPSTRRLRIGQRVLAVVVGPHATFEVSATIVAFAGWPEGRKPWKQLPGYLVKCDNGASNRPDGLLHVATWGVELMPEEEGDQGGEADAPSPRPGG